MHEHDDDQLPVRDLGEVLDGFRFAMVATVVDGTITSRPLTLLEQDGPTLRFLVAAAAPWVQALGTGATVHAAFADTADETYVAVEGVGASPTIGTPSTGCGTRRRPPSSRA